MTAKIVYEIGDMSIPYEEYVKMDEYKTEDSEYNICKYCGENDPLKFSSKAHLIPEFTGNKEWFCNNECDKCNNGFSAYEYNLKNFGAFKNSYLPISGKKKFPKYTDGNEDFILQFQADKSLKMDAKNIDSFKTQNERIYFKSLTMPFVPLNVYKCLFKIALGMMKKDDFEKFSSSIAWLKDKKMKVEPKIPLLLLYNPNSKPVIKPIALLLKRKESYNCPEYSFIFIWGFSLFQIFLPFNPNDENLNYEELKLPILPMFTIQKQDGKIGLSHFDMNSLKKIQSHAEISFGAKMK